MCFVYVSKTADLNVVVCLTLIINAVTMTLVPRQVHNSGVDLISNTICVNDSIDVLSYLSYNIVSLQTVLLFYYGWKYVFHSTY